MDGATGPYSLKPRFTEVIGLLEEVGSYATPALSYGDEG